MFLINCPYCGERDQAEFSCGGEAHIVRPKNPPELSDDQWAEYLFLRKNEKGIHSSFSDNLMDDFDRDRALSPTQYLKSIRKDIISQLIGSPLMEMCFQQVLPR